MTNECVKFQTRLYIPDSGRVITADSNSAGFTWTKERRCDRISVAGEDVELLTCYHIPDRGKSIITAGDDP